MFGTLGGPEVFLILVIALIVFGPRKLPEIGKSVGKMMNEFRRASNEFRRTVEDEVEADKARALAAPVASVAPVAEPLPGTIAVGAEPLPAPLGSEPTAGEPTAAEVAVAAVESPAADSPQPPAPIDR